MRQHGARGLILQEALWVVMVAAIASNNSVLAQNGL